MKGRGASTLPGTWLLKETCSIVLVSWLVFVVLECCKASTSVPKRTQRADFACGHKSLLDIVVN